MRVHNAVWYFAECFGNDWARKYARDRKTLSDTERIKKDTEWLRGHGGKRLRDLWFAVPVETRQLMVEKTRDDSLPGETDGVLNERTKSGIMPSTNRATKRNSVSASVTKAKSAHRTSTKRKSGGKISTHQTDPVRTLRGNASAEKTDIVLQKKVVVMRPARAAYHRIASSEHLLKLQTAYDSGNMTGVIEATVRSVTHAIHLARAHDRASNAEEAHEVVSTRVADVLGPAHHMTRFESEFASKSGLPSPEFAAARLPKALKNYQSSVLRAHEECRVQGITIDPDSAILEATHALFGKAEGISSL